MNFFSPSGLETEGIFRINGSLTNINEIRDTYESGQPVRLYKYGVNDVAGVLKLYLKSLPEVRKKEK